MFAVGDDSNNLIVTNRGTIVHTTLAMVRQIIVTNSTSTSAIYRSNLVHLVRWFFSDVAARDKYPGR